MRGGETVFVESLQMQGYGFADQPGDLGFGGTGGYRGSAGDRGLARLYMATRRGAQRGPHLACEPGRSGT